MTDDNDYTNVILEDINAKFNTVLELVDLTRQDMKSLAKQSSIDEMKSDIKVIKAVLTDSGKQLIDHETRIAKLELA